jgi:hypothetical protein
MIKNHYGYELKFPWLSDEQDFEMTSYTITNICNHEFVLPFQWKEIILKAWETKSMPAWTAICVAWHICTQYLANNNKVASDSTAPELIYKILWINKVDYSKINYDDLVKLATDKWLETSVWKWAKKKDLTKAELINALSEV